VGKKASYRFIILTSQYISWLVSQLLRIRYSIRAHRPTGIFFAKRTHCLILVANHRTYVDLGLLMVALGYGGFRALAPIRILGTQDFRSPLLTTLKPLIKAVYKIEGVIVLPPETNEERSLPEKLRGMLVALHQGEVAAIFPEGQLWRKRNPPIGEFAPGVVYLHRKSNAPIVPIGVWMSERSWPRRRYFAEVGWPVTIPEGLDQEAGAIWLRDVVLKLYQQAERSGSQ
jgi:1-acyl-sn-glycerol-3-phosphate acyltransferase